MSGLASECCGAAMTGLMEDYGICPDCKEHCEVVDLEEDLIEIPPHIQDLIKFHSKGDSGLGSVMEAIYEAGFIRGEIQGAEWGQAKTKEIIEKAFKEK